MGLFHQIFIFGYPTSYPIGYPGNKLPGYGSHNHCTLQLIYMHYYYYYYILTLLTLPYLRGGWVLATQR